ncbi:MULTISPECIES: cytochrome c oxidase subunit 4 [unclassified Luteococcus]|uniref:cytochrome c oxidase subunit 4 n=1 Tax=unclassified Luteococcus TaxID=2639923 RepID=UPI00313EC13C
MKVERNIFGFLGVFYLTCALVYFFVFAKMEWVGFFVLALSAAMSLMISGYLAVVGAKNDTPLSDIADATIADGAGALGFFPPHSIWPFWVALVASLMLLGPIFGWWLSIMAFGMGIWAVSGWVFEFYRGDYAH